MENYKDKSREDLIREIEELRNQISLLHLSDTERQLALDAQYETEKQYRHLLESIHEIVYIIDKHTRLLFISPRAKEVFGYDPVELHGKKLFDLIYPDDLAAVKQKRKVLSEVQDTSHEFRVFHKDGSIRHVHATCRILHSKDQEPVLTGIINDITEKKLSSIALRESQIKFRILETSIEDPIWVLDLNLKYIYISPSIIKIRGRSAEEVLSTSIEKMFQPEVYKKWVEILREEVAYEESGLPRKLNYRLIEFDLPDKDGRQIFVESKVSFLKDQDQKVIGIIGVNRDITERKILEDQTRKSLEEKEILLKEIHHRVKNNFQIITSLLNLQENRIHDKELLEIYKDSQNRIRAMALIHERLYQSGNLASIDMGEYIHTIAEELLDTYESTADRVEMLIDARPVMLEINQAIPCGLLINEILTNAIKYGFPPYFPDKGIIKISISSDGRFIYLDISDNGIGIPDHINFDNPETLGLQLISMITRNQLKGTIELNRRFGTTFSITFSNKLCEEDDVPSDPAVRE